MAAVLPAPPGTIYFFNSTTGMWQSPGREDVARNPEDPPGLAPPLLTDSEHLVDDGRVLRV